MKSKPPLPSAEARVCRSCGAPLWATLLDLGEMPLANRLVEPAQSSEEEPLFPLRAMVCERCFLVQLYRDVPPETMFADYIFRSSISSTWRRHCEGFAKQAVRRLSLDANSRVIEIASNDGCLLEYFQRRGIAVLGIEPAATLAAETLAKGIPTERGFFTAALARKLAASSPADLIVANNVLAHAPDLNDFIAGLASLLQPDGAISVEVPHLVSMLDGLQFDTIYHEHVFYFSLLAVEPVFRRHGLIVVDVEEIPIHGGSLRLWLERTPRAPGHRVETLRERERRSGLERLGSYSAFAPRVLEAKAAFVDFLKAQRRAGRAVAGYSASAKGAILLNYCRAGEFFNYVADRNAAKQGKLLPGVRLPIVAPERILETRPDYVIVLSRNILDEVMAENAALRGWGGRFVVPLPALDVL